MQPFPAMQAMDVINRQLYAKNLVPRYVARHDLTRAESVVFERYRADCASGHVLDLGCGTGRLAEHLLGLTHDYHGVDISPHMVGHCRAKYPVARFTVADIRELELDPASVNTVFAIANLFDAVPHDDRLRVLAALREALVPGGLLVFSTHNRRWTEAGSGPRLERGGGPVRRLRQLGEFVLALWNHGRIRPFERTTADYALYNDSGHNYSVLHYYIDREAQALQLARLGFRLLEVIDEDGRTLGPDDGGRASSSLVYVARR